MPFFIRLRNVANSVDNRLIKEAVILGLHRSRNYKKKFENHSVYKVKKL